MCVQQNVRMVIAGKAVLGSRGRSEAEKIEVQQVNSTKTLNLHCRSR